MAAKRQIRTHNALRGIAALLVVFYHLQLGAPVRLPFETATPLFARSYLMVDLFFLLSGFIISYANDADRAGAWDRGRVRRFLVGRVIRLYPLHLVCLAGLVGWAALLALVYHNGSAFAPRSLSVLLAQLLLVNAWIPGAIGWNVPTWSISAEAVAYLLFPAIAIGWARRPRLATAAMLLLPLGFYLWVEATGGSLDRISGVAPLRCLAGFLPGMLIFFARDRIARAPDALLTIGQIAAIAAMIAVLAVPLPDVVFIPAAAVLVATTWTDRGLAARLLGGGVFRWLGEISYSIYLTHVGVLAATTFVLEVLVPRLGLDLTTFRLLQIAISLLLTLALSTLTFRFVEGPARAWLGERLLHRHLRPIETAPAAP